LFVLFTQISFILRICGKGRKKYKGVFFFWLHKYKGVDENK